MSELTPERRAEIEHINATAIHQRRDIATELLAEIDRLTADRDQLSNALDLAAAELEAQTKEIGRLLSVVDQVIEYAKLNYGINCESRYPILAAELERRIDI
jgi:hypothetical protein